MIYKIKRYLLYKFFKKDEAIAICLKHQIPLTDININEVRNVLIRQKNVGSDEAKK